MSIIVQGTTNQKLSNFESDKGFLPGEFSDIKLTAKHLVYIYLTKLTYKLDRDTIYVDTESLGNKLNCSTRTIQRHLTELVDETLLIKKDIRNGFRGYQVMKKYDRKTDYLIPDILLVADIPLGFKLFVLKLRLLTPASEKGVVVFKTERELRDKTVNNHYTLQTYINKLAEINVIVHEESGFKIDVQRIFDMLLDDLVVKQLLQVDKFKI